MRQLIFVTGTELTMKLILLLGLVLWAGVESFDPYKDYQRMRDLGQNAKFGPNLLSHSKFHRTTATPKKDQTEKRALEDYLLPDDVEPLSYVVELIPYFKDALPPNTEFTFDGHVDMRIRAVRPTSTVMMHAADMTIESMNVTESLSGQNIIVTDWEISNDDKNFLTINLGSQLESGREYHISIVFQGNLNSQGFGFFRSAYYDDNFNLLHAATTQFESTGARQAFPCFDEPNSKATFTIALALDPTEYTAVANMPLASTYPADEPAGWTWWRFEETPRMSSYLVAFTVSKFVKLESPKNSRFAVWARDSKIQLGEHANDVAPDLFDYYQQYTQTDYGMPKVDQLGFVDFFSGAMENWGHISYVESLLLLDPDTASPARVQLSTQVISHELTHQWFGNIISPAWWSDLWLNEGFATYFEFFGTGALNPGWAMDQQFQVDMMHSAFETDASIFGSHPVHADVDSPNSIDAIFDNMSYNKGGCLVRFMLNLLGPDNFRNGIIEYMRKNAYSGAHQDDLFAALAPFVPAGLLPSGVSLAQVMDTWTLQAGVPVLTVTRDYQAQTAQIQQDRFSNNGAEQWLVPLTLTSTSELNFDDLAPKGWLITAEREIGANEGVPAQDEWLLLNLQQTGYYRVNYDQANWDMLFAFLEDANTEGLIPPLNRAQILDDSAALSRANLLSYSYGLAATKYLHRETELGPWSAALTNLEFIRDRMYQTPETADLFNSYVASKLQNVFTKINGLSAMKSEDHSVKILRSLVSKWACNTGLQQCSDQGKANSIQWQQQSQPDKINPINAGVRSVSYCEGVRQGDLTDYNFYMGRYIKTEDTEEHPSLLGALGCASDEALLQMYLNEIIKPSSNIRKGDALSVFFSVYSNPIGTDLALDFLIQNYQQLKHLMPVGVAFMAISEKLNTQEHYKMIQMFLDDASADLATQDQALIQASLLVLEGNLEWNAAHLGEVMLFFVQNHP